MFHNEDIAINQLQIISYFRIANYLKSFEVVGFDHDFLPNSYFEEALDLYYFDKKLRNLLFSAIQSIEVALRSKIDHLILIACGKILTKATHIRLVLMSMIMLLANTAKVQGYAHCLSSKRMGRPRTYPIMLLPYHEIAEARFPL